MGACLDARARLRSELRWSRGGLENLRAREIQRLQKQLLGRIPHIIAKLIPHFQEGFIPYLPAPPQVVT